MFLSIWESHLTPISETGGKRKKYSPYYGRGFVQLTWEYNYAAFTKLLKSEAGITADLVNNKELALVPTNAAFIAVYGMKVSLAAHACEALDARLICMSDCICLLGFSCSMVPSPVVRSASTSVLARLTSSVLVPSSMERIRLPPSRAWRRASSSWHRPCKG